MTVDFYGDSICHCDVMRALKGQRALFLSFAASSRSWENAPKECRGVLEVLVKMSFVKMLRNEMGLLLLRHAIRDRVIGTSVQCILSRASALDVNCSLLLPTSSQVYNPQFNQQ